MKKNSFEEGTIIATLAIFLVKILGMIYVIPFYSIVGADGGALYSYAYNIYLLFLGISSAGLPNAISKIISEYNALGLIEEKNRTYKLAKKITMIISILSFAVLFVFAEEIGRFIIGDLKGTNTYADVAFVIRCVAPSILVIPFLSITKGYLQGHKYMGPSSVSQIIEQIVRIFIILCGSFLILKVFNGSLSLAIGLAVSGALFGGITAYIYLKLKIKKWQKELNLKEETITKKQKISDKEIVKKIITYAIPFIIINIVTNIYNNTDQILVLRTLSKIGYPDSEVEFIASAISTWSPKICMILNAVAMGMTMSLIPTIVSAYSKKDKNEVEGKINKAISMIIYISLPLMLGLIILAIPAWKIFYGTNPYGPIILRLAVISAFFANIYMVISTICQSLNKYATVYIMSISGFVSNALLDIPLMLLMHKMGFEGFLGSLLASIFGFSLSCIIGLISLHHNENIRYKKVLEIVGKSLIPSIAMIIILSIVNMFLPFDVLTIFGAIITIIINALIGGLTFVIISYKLGIIDYIFGHEMINKIVKKLTLGKLNI